MFSECMAVLFLLPSLCWLEESHANIPNPDASKFLTTSQPRSGGHDSLPEPSSASSTPSTAASAARNPYRAPAYARHATSQSTPGSSRLFYSAAETLPEADESSRALNSPGRTWPGGRVGMSRHAELREEDEDEDDARTIGSNDDPHQPAIMQNGTHSLNPSRLFSGRRSIFARYAPAAGNSIIGATNTGHNTMANSRLTLNGAFDEANEEEADDRMTGTYTGHLYGADSAIRSSWKPYEEEEEDAGGSQLQIRIAEEEANDGKGADDGSKSGVLTLSHNSMESVGLESIVSRARQQSPPPPRLRFKENPYPRNMTAATMNATNARRHVYLDEYEDGEQRDAHIRQRDLSDFTDIGHANADMEDEMPGGFPSGDVVIPQDTIDPTEPSRSDSGHNVLSESARLRPSGPVLGQEYTPPVLYSAEIARAQDIFWSKLYLLSMCCLFATSFTIWLETEVTAPIKLTDSIFTVIRGSLSILALDTFLAICISAVWFVLLQKCVRPVLSLLIVLIPFCLLGLTMYPLIMSYRDSWGGNSVQDKAMRWTSLVPAVSAVVWVWMAIRTRSALGRAIGIVQLSCKILAENRILIVLSLGTLVSFVAFSWLWFAMFARVFLRGKIVVGSSGISMWILDQNSWALGAWYIFMYLWTWGVFSGVQRCVYVAYLLC